MLCRQALAESPNVRGLRKDSWITRNALSNRWPAREIISPQNRTFRDIHSIIIQILSVLRNNTIKIFHNLREFTYHCPPAKKCAAGCTFYLHSITKHHTGNIRDREIFQLCLHSITKYLCFITKHLNSLFQSLHSDTKYHEKIKKYRHSVTVLANSMTSPANFVPFPTNSMTMPAGSIRVLLHSMTSPAGLVFSLANSVMMIANSILFHFKKILVCSHPVIKLHRNFSTNKFYY